MSTIHFNVHSTTLHSSSIHSLLSETRSIHEMREKRTGAVVAAAVAILEKQQTLNGSRSFPVKSLPRPSRPPNNGPARQDLAESDPAETRKRSPSGTSVAVAKNNEHSEEPTPQEQCTPRNSVGHADGGDETRENHPVDNFELAVKDFDSVARDVENIVAKGKTDPEDDGSSDETSDSESEREHVIDEGLDTITEEDRNTLSSVRSSEGIVSFFLCRGKFEFSC